MSRSVSVSVGRARLVVAGSAGVALGGLVCLVAGLVAGLPLVVVPAAVSLVLGSVRAVRWARAIRRAVRS